MADKQSTTGLVLIDLINEIVDPKGKLAGKGYAEFVERHGTLDKVHQLLSAARSEGIPIFHVRVAFSPDYKEQPEASPLFGGAKKFAALENGSWGAEFHPKASPKTNEAEMIKHRVSAFYGTPLDLVLRTYGITEILVCGVATDLAVQSAARDAHDRDYVTTIVADCCAAATDEDHDQALRLLSKIASVKVLADIGFASKLSA